MGFAENLYLQIVAKLKARLINGRQYNVARGELPNNYNAAQPIEIQIERMKIKPFDGSFAKWKEFHDTFVAMVHAKNNITNVQKLHLLKGAVVGDAARVLGSWQLTDANYAMAWQRMIEVYNDDYQIIQAHLEKLFCMPKMCGETYLGIRNLIDTTDEALRSLRVLNVPVENWDTMIIFVITSRLHHSTLDAWEMHRDVQHLPTLRMLFDFLERRARAISNAHGKIGEQFDKREVKSSTQARPSRSDTYSNQNYDRSDHDLLCKLCKGHHLISKCHNFLRLRVEERRRKIKELRLCFNCLKSGHAANSCALGPCFKCNENKKHSSLLCDKYHDMSKNDNSDSVLLAIERTSNYNSQ